MRLKRTKHSLLSISLLLTISMFSAYKSACQNISYVGHLEKKDGLADRIVNNISRDSDGYFYLFFNQSIQRYDGRNFIDIKTSTNESVSRNFRPQLIYESNNNTPIVILENKPYESFFIQNNQLKPLMQSPLMESASPADSVFVSGNRDQLFSFKKIDHKYLISPINDKFNNFIFELSSVNLPEKTFYHKQSNKLFLEYRNGDILVYNDKNKKVTSAQGKLIRRNNDIILANISGIYLWNNFKFNLLKSFPNNPHKCLWVKKDKMNNVMIAYHKDIARVTNLHILKPNNKVLNYNKILDHVFNIKDIYAENFFQEILVASFNSLYIIKFQNPGLQLIYNEPKKSNSVFGNVITGVKSVENGNLVFFTRETDGLFSFEKTKPDQVVRINTNIDYTNSNSLAFDNVNQKLYSSRYTFEGEGNINIYDLETKNQKQIPIDFSPSGISSIYGNKIFVFGSIRNKKHINSESQGIISSFDIQTKEISTLNFPSNSLRNNIRAFYYDSESSEYWVGSSDGLFRIDNNYQVIQEYNNQRTDKYYHIKIPHIRLIKRFNEYLFIGTKGDGLYILDWNTKHIIQHKTEEGDLTDNNIIAMEKSLDNKYWIASFNGISTFDNNLKLVNKLYDKDGLSNPEFNTSASDIDINGNIYFGSINGITAINSEKTLSAKEFTRINIESIKTFENGKTSTLSIKKSPIRIKENVDSFSLNYNIPQYFKHYYQEQKDLINILNIHEQNIQIDNSSIRIRDINKGQFNIEIAQPFTKIISTVFHFKVVRNYIPILLTAFAIAAFLGIWYLFTSQKIQSNRELEQEKTKFNKKLGDLELTALRSQMNPHFIFNALGAVQYFINTRDIEKADGYLTKFAKLMRSILESSKSKYIRLQDEIEMLKLYVSLEHIRFEEKFTYKFEIDDETDTIDFQIPSMIIQPVVENAINHGLYHLVDRKGELTISFIEKNEDHIICQVKDNGIGRKSSAKLRKKKTHKSRGMQIVNERIHALKLNEEFDINITVIDLIDENTGTIVEISIERK